MKKGLVEQKPGAILAFAAYTNKIPNIVKFAIGEPDFNTNDGFKLKPEKLQAVLDKYGDKVRMLVMKSNRCDVQPRRTKCHCWCYSR